MENSRRDQLLVEADRLHESGDFVGAIGIYDLLIEAFPHIGELRVNRCVFRRDAAQWAELLEDAEAGLKLKPSLLQLRALKGQALEELDRLQEALRVWEDLSAEHPEYPAPYKDRGRVLWDCGFPEPAIECLTTYLRLKPDDAGGYAIRGMAYKAAGRFKEALEDLNAAIVNERDNGFLFFQRSEVHTALGQTEMAEEDRKRFIEIAKRKAADSRAPSG